jgi:hypothetical protein
LLWRERDARVGVYERKREGESAKAKRGSEVMESQDSQNWKAKCPRRITSPINLLTPYHHVQLTGCSFVDEEGCLGASSSRNNRRDRHQQISVAVPDEETNGNPSRSTNTRFNSNIDVDSLISTPSPAL